VELDMDEFKASINLLELCADILANSGQGIDLGTRAGIVGHAFSLQG
jgi:hypothetical protein